MSAGCVHINSFADTCITSGDKAAYLMQSAAEKAHSVKEAGEDKGKASPKKAAPKKAAPKKAEAGKKKAAPKKVGSFLPNFLQKHVCIPCSKSFVSCISRPVCHEDVATWYMLSIDSSTPVGQLKDALGLVFH